MRIFSLLILLSITGISFSQIKLKEYANDKLGLKEATLANGMKVFLIENHNKPEVFGSFVVNVGSKNDPQDNTGMAHYLEHMLFKGTQTMGTLDYEKEKVHLDKINGLYNQLGLESDDEKRLEIQKKINEESKLAGEYALPNEFDRIIAEMGGTELNAFTSNDMTVYLNKFPPNQIEKWLDVYVHRFQKPVFRLFQSELETVYEEKNRSMNEPIQYLIERYTAKMFAGHPYGEQTTLGKTAHLKNPSLKAMYDYYNKYYVANNMALVLAGDFKSEDIIELINQKLSQFPKSNLKKEENFTITSIKGKREETLKSSPVKMAIYGFRIDGQNKIDQAKIDLLLALLQNDSETGLIDQLRTNGKVMASQIFEYTLEEQGSIAILNIPKLIGQSFEKAEVLLFAQLDSLKQGKFSDDLFNSVKNELVKYKKTTFEDNEDLSRIVYDYFISHEDWNKVINYESNLEALTKANLIEYANQIFKEDYVVLYSKMGKTKMEKLKKPPFKAIPSKNSQKSKYYDFYNEIETTALTVDYVNFEEDIKSIQLNAKTQLNHTLNPKNDVFDLTYSWNIGSVELPSLAPLASYLNLIGTSEKEFNVFRKELQNLNASYYIDVDDKNFSLMIDGEDKNLAKTVELITKLLVSPAKDESKLKEVVQEEKYMNKENKSTPSSVVRLLREYAVYKEESKYLNKTSVKTIGGFSTDFYLKSLNTLLKQNKLRVDYVGNNQNIKSIIEDQLKAFPVLKKEKISSPNKSYLDRLANYESENTIYFINDKKATQTNIYFDIDLSNIPQEEHYKLQAFNEYFGRGMSSLVFQEIREFRSLAYTAYGICRVGKTPELNEAYVGYIGCQNDKTIDALTTMMDLINNMPQKPERIDYIKGAITNSAITSRPGFRNLSNQIEMWKEQGYKTDPNYLFKEKYKALTFSEIIEFYNTYLKNKPVTISMVGDKKQINFEELATFGVIKEVKIKDIYVD